MLSLAGPFTREQCGADRLSRMHGRRLVCDDGANHLRPPGRLIRLHVGKSGQRLDNRIIDSFLDVWTSVADAGNRNIHQAWVEFAHGRFVDTQPLHQTGTEILHQDVGAGDQPA